MATAGDVHCWMGKREHAQAIGDAAMEAETWDGDESRDASCMLLDGHEGPHVFTSDERIVVRLAGAPHG